MKRIDYSIALLSKMLKGGRQPLRSTIIALIVADTAKQWPGMSGYWVSSSEIYEQLGPPEEWKCGLEAARKYGLLDTTLHPKSKKALLYSLTNKGTRKVRELLEAKRNTLS